ncbi:MAG: restriction endonuclease subunit S [Thermodesulfovibrionales bacterium]
MSESEVPISSVATITMGLSPKGETYNTIGEGGPLLNGPTEFGDFYPNCTLFTTDSKRECKKGDLIFCVRGSTTGRMNWADKRYSLGRGVCSIAGKTEMDTRFIKYCLDVKLDALLKNAGGGTFPNLRKDDIEGFQIPFPIYRQKIATILSAYDDLIENNNRRIKILEEMAQAIYKEWLVNFRFPGHEKIKMVKSELGMIPEGWAVKEMQEVADVIDCLHSKKPKEIENGNKFLLQLFNISEGGKLDLSKKYYIADEDYELWTRRIEASEGDCVVTNVGRIAAVAQIPQGIKAALGRNMTAVRANKKFITPPFLIQYLLSPHMESEVLKKTDRGTIMDSLNVKNIVKLSINIPTSEIMENFDNAVKPIRRRIELLVNQNMILRRTRDLLLPKLISGEVDVEKMDIQGMGA